MAGVRLLLEVGAPALRGTDCGAGPAVRLLDHAEAMALGTEAAALADAAVEDNPFFHPDILFPAMRHLPGGAAIKVAAIRNSRGRLIAWVPFRPTRLGRLVSALEGWAHPYGPVGVPLVAKGEERAAISALIAGLGDRPLLFPFIALDGSVAGALRTLAVDLGRPVTVLDDHERAAVTQVAGTSDFRRGLPTRRRKEFARQLRRLSDLGEVSVTTVLDPASVGDAFEEFLALEAAGWKGRGKTALAAQPGILAFAREMIGRRAAKGACRIAALRLDGRPIAMLVSMLSPTSAVTWKIAHDEGLARFSPGAQLILEATPALLSERGVASIDSLAAPDHPMIDHLWRERLSVGTLVVGPAGASGAYRLALAAAGAEARLRHTAKNLIRRAKKAHSRETSP